MSTPNPRHIPTLGYPSQKAAIVALHKQGHDADTIARVVGAPINSVQRALSEYRQKYGIPAPKRKPQSPYEIKNDRPDSIWDMDEDKRRDEIRRRAALAAREARLAA